MLLEEQKSTFASGTNTTQTNILSGFASYNHFSGTNNVSATDHSATNKKFGHYSSFDSSGVSTSSLMHSLSGSGKTVSRTALTEGHHDDGDHDHSHNHVHAPNEISAAGVTFNPDAGPSATDPYYVNALKSGAVWANSGTGITINYKFWSALPSYYSGADQESHNFQPFTASMKTATQEILGFLQNLVNVTFAQVSSESSAQLGFAQAELTAVDGSWAFYPGSYSKAGDVWTNNLYATSTQNVTHGLYGFQTLLHEIGHAMGLKHSFSGGTVLTGDEDTSRYTVMSYSWPMYAESYMLYDIAALQSLYGANTNYATGDNNYSLISGHAYTIWDAGGSDTMDGSGLTSDLILNLNEGTFSNVGATRNIAVAFGVTIENATGGSGNDTLYGNAVSNNIQGNDGNDIIYGSAGNDTLDGGAGTDTLRFNASVADFTINVVNSTTLMLTHATMGITTATNFESFNFNGATATLADLQALSSGDIDIISVGITVGTTTRAYESLFTNNTTLTSANLGIGGTVTSMFTLNRTSNTDMTITALSTKAPGKLALTADDDGSNIIVDGVHKAMAVTFNGAGGDDSFTATATITGIDIVHGGGGNDTFHTGNGNDSIYGDDGNDTIYGEVGNDTVYGGAGTDTVYGGLGIDKIYGDDGDDNLNSDDGNDFIYGGNGNDTTNGGAGNDIIYGGADNDTVSGGLGVDKLYGESGDDTLHGNDGNDMLYGGDGSDTASGGVGIDKIYGDAGNDTLYGDDGNDTIYGGSDADTIFGGAGNDILYGDAGSDTLVGGAGKDTLYGGTESDIFGFNVVDTMSDLIKDFTLSGVGADKLNVTDILSGYDALTDNINDFVRITGATTKAATLQVNQDGVGTDWVTVAVLNGSSFTGVTASSLTGSGQLIADQPL